MTHDIDIVLYFFPFFIKNGRWHHLQYLYFSSYFPSLSFLFSREMRKGEMEWSKVITQKLKNMGQKESRVSQYCLTHAQKGQKRTFWCLLIPRLAMGPLSHTLLGLGLNRFLKPWIGQVREGCPLFFFFNEHEIL